MIRAVAYGVVAALLLALQGASEPVLARYHQVHAAMGTEFAIDVYAVDERTADQAMEAAFDEVDRLEELLSNYRASSELSRISRDAGKATVTTDPETYRFLERSLFWSQQSDGAFDITVGPLLRAWGFFYHGGRIPTDTELLDLRKKVGWQKIKLGPAHTVRFVGAQAMDLDPGSIGKGFAVDAAVSVLKEAGVRQALISAGGSTIYAMSAPPGEAGWPVRVDDPREAGVVMSTVYLKDTSLSSGACTQKFFIKDGHRYCHIFNPRTMRPVEGVLQSTVISPSATDSDALSTVVFVLSAEESLKVLKQFTGTEALVFGPSLSDTGCVALNWQSPLKRLSRPCSVKIN